MSIVRAAALVLTCLLAATHAGAQAVAPPVSPAEAGIRETLRQYSTALENLDADAVKKVQPAIEVEALKKAFREMKSLKVAIEDVRVLAAGDDAARVSCRVTQTLTPKAGSKQTTAVTRVLRLRRQVGAWTIEMFER